MDYVLTWTGDGGPARVALASAEEAVKRALALGAPGVEVRILIDGQMLTFDELRRIVIASRRA